MRIGDGTISASVFGLENVYIPYCGITLPSTVHIDVWVGGYLLFPIYAHIHIHDFHIIPLNLTATSHTRFPTVCITQQHSIYWRAYMH